MLFHCYFKSYKFTFKQVLFGLVFLSLNFKAQNKMNKLIDSLKVEFKSASNDTVRARIYYAYTELLYLSKPDTVIPLCKLAIELCDKNLNKANPAEKRSYLLTKASSLNNIGYIYQNKNSITLALEYYHAGMKIQEEINDRVGLGQSLNNIGFVYQTEHDMARALQYYQKSLKLREEINDKRGIAETLNNLGFLYRNFGDPDCISTVKDICRKAGFFKALEYYTKSLKIKESIRDSLGIAVSYNNIGTIHKFLLDYDKALDYYGKCLKIRQSRNDKQGEAIVINSIGSINYFKKNYDEAEKNSMRSLTLGKEIGYPDVIKRAAELLKDIYIAKGDYKKSMEMFNIYIVMRDSMNNQAAQKAAEKKELEYEYHLKTEADSLKLSQERKVMDVERSHEKTQRIGLIGGLLLVIIFSGFMFNRFRITQKQKRIIEVQKHLVEEKQKEIVDSINYAQLIQKALLTSEEVLQNNFTENFILFKPKAIVSGDFYWTSPLANGNFALAVADSTGHGVPGAIMSMLNIACLNEMVTKGSVSPDKILFETRSRIIQYLKNDGTSGGHDGMDCSLMCFDFKNKILYAAAANNPVWIIRKYPAAHAELIEVKPDKMPIGKHEKDQQPFTLHTIQLQSGDTIYALTDGFPDQFGGEKNKKFTAKNLQQLLLANTSLPLLKQKEILDIAFKNWKGSYEQIDDVTLLGVKI